VVSDTPVGTQGAEGSTSQQPPRIQDYLATPDQFAAWLRQHQYSYGPSSVVGYTCDADRCPLASWVRSLHIEWARARVGTVVALDGDTAYSRDYYLPLWAQRFSTAVDLLSPLVQADSRGADTSSALLQVPVSSVAALACLEMALGDGDLGSLMGKDTSSGKGKRRGKGKQTQEQTQEQEQSSTDQEEVSL
jgi:hypothetical protein